MQHPQSLTAVTVEHLTVERGGREILRQLSFRAEAGEVLLLTGPNGSGKTTLIRTVAGFLRPVAGRIVLEGVGDEIELAELCHYVGHVNGSKNGLTVEENLAFWASYLGGGGATVQAERVALALERFNLRALSDIPAGYLSAGQKRRLGLARLLVADRPLWLLDEPTVSLDSASAALLAGVLDAHVAAGGLAVAATHLPLGLARARELRLGGRAAAP